MISIAIHLDSDLSKRADSLRVTGNTPAPIRFFIYFPKSS